MPLSEGVTGLLPWKQQHLKLLSGNFRGASLRSTGRTRSHPAPPPPMPVPNPVFAEGALTWLQAQGQAVGAGADRPPNLDLGHLGSQGNKTAYFFPQKNSAKGPKLLL